MESLRLLQPVRQPQMVSRGLVVGGAVLICRVGSPGDELPGRHPSPHPPPLSHEASLGLSSLLQGRGGVGRYGGGSEVEPEPTCLSLSVSSGKWDHENVGIQSRDSTRLAVAEARVRWVSARYEGCRTSSSIFCFYSSRNSKASP